jgi:hypothetical protein
MSDERDSIMARAQALVDQYGDDIPPDVFKAFAQSIKIQAMELPPGIIYYLDHRFGPKADQPVGLTGSDYDPYAPIEREYRRETECYHRCNAFDCTWCPETQVWIDF